jgi:hypothetical protein
MSDANASPLPTAKEVLQQAAIRKAERARENAGQKDAEEVEKRALIDQLSGLSDNSEHAKISLTADVIRRAVVNGLTEVQVYTFPTSLCTDRGRAISSQNPGWDRTLTGIPKEIFQLWTDHLQPRGYRIRYQIIDFPGGMPGDIAITLSWG